MTATLTYDLSVIGRAAVERELASLERRFAQHARTLNRTTGMGVTGARPAGAASAAVDRSAQRAVRDNQRAIDQRVRSQTALHNQRTREEQQFSRAQARSAADQQRQIDRQVRSQTSLSRQRMREERMVQRERERITAARVDFARTTVGGGMSRVAGGIAGAGRIALATTGLAGAGLAASAVSQAVKLDEVSRRLSIASRAPGEAGVDSEVLRREFTNTAIGTGFDPVDIANATQTYVAKTGDLATARANQKVFATVAQGAGATPADVFAAAADLSSKLDVSSVKDMSEAFAILSQQGKKGSFELKAMAGEFPEILASASTAGVRGVAGVRDVGAIAQIARQASGSDAEASTAIQSMFRQLAAESMNLQTGKALGGKKVSVFENNDPTKPMRNFAEVVSDVISTSGGNLPQLQKVFDIRGMRAINPLLSAFREAKDKTLKGGGTAKQADESGRQAISELFSKFRDVPADFGEVQRDARDAMQGTGIQFTVAMTQLKDAIGTQLLPELTKLIPQIAQLTPHVTALVQGMIRAASFLANNPWTGLGLLVGGALVAEIAKAGMSKAIASAVTALLSGNGIPGVGTTVPGVKGLATAKGAGAMAAATIGVALAADQASSFMDENGGFRGLKNFVGLGDQKGFGFDAVNAMMDSDAKRAAAERASAVQQAAAVTPQSLPGLTAPAVPQLSAEEANAQLAELAQKLATANAMLATMGASRPNTGDRPTGIK